MALSLAALTAAHSGSTPAPAPKASIPGAGSFTRGRPPVRPAAPPASVPQKDLIRKLLAERAGVAQAEVIRAALNDAKTKGTLTVPVASAAIKDLLALPKPVVVVEDPENADEAALIADEIAADAPQVHTEVWPGRYTVETPGDHFTFRVEVQPTDAEFAPGKTVLALLTGPDNTERGDYTSFAFVVGGKIRVWGSKKTWVSEATLAAAAQLLSDPDSAIKVKHCIRCNADLTVPSSVAQGMGPTCIKKGW